MSNCPPSQQAALERSAALDQRVQAAPWDFRVLTGDRPTGALHLGHYLGTLANHVRLQNLGVEVIVLIADYQVMTDQRASQRLPTTVRGILADYLAAGIDPERSTIFTHSAVPALNELVLPFLSLVSDAELHRNPTVKAEAEATRRPPTGLMLTYPVHQAADILFCRANIVPVGLDQLPHLETTRLIARRFNERYANKSPLFPEPDALLTATPMVAGLDGQKMSKSRENGITLQATEDQTAAAIRRAPTDSQRRITYDPLARPAVSNLLDLLAAASGADPRQLADEIGDGGAGRLKQMVTEAINELLRPVRTRRAGLAQDTAYLDSVLETGNTRARQLADHTLTTVHGLLGMTYANRRRGLAQPLQSRHD
ncbi:MAG: tryptophan--tRNA ligase [Actinomycetota bacterium]|nr:tryptophan--tRNA ligase [Actinomycetota bacterium]